MNEVTKLLEKTGIQIVSEMKKILLQNRKRATGNLINSITFRIKDNSIEIGGATYGVYVDKGRKAGSKMPPIKAILNWIKIKRISIGNSRSRTMVAKGKKQPTLKTQEQIAFLIARGISKNGIKPLNYTAPLKVLKTTKFKNDLKKAITMDLKKKISGKK